MQWHSLSGDFNSYPFMRQNDFYFEKVSQKCYHNTDNTTEHHVTGDNKPEEPFYQGYYTISVALQRGGQQQRS